MAAAIALDDVKAIGRAAGGTVNDVLLAAVTGALRRYLQERGALPDQTMIASVPMALHHEEGAASGNAVTTLNARLGTDVTDDAWRQWVLDWNATSGKHTIQVRATDKTGATQTADVAPPDPDGATGPTPNPARRRTPSRSAGRPTLAGRP